MKKSTLFLIALLSMTYMSRAQQYVSTTPSNKNVVIEYYTGRSCGYCPIAHRVTREIMNDNPGRVWTIAYHYGSLSPTGSPNLNTSFGGPHASSFGFGGTPEGLFNRSTSSAAGITETGSNWFTYVNQQLNQAAICNVGGLVKINPDTREANITVEVYYTDNSSVNENYLAIMMVQDSIKGAQSDYGNYNPGGWIGSQYVHMDALRDVLTPLWGDAISPTSQGTLITKTYTYQIPATIGSPNGVAVNLDHIKFIAMVAEKYQGTPTRPILNACELTKTILTDEPIYPMMNAVSQEMIAECTTEKSFDVNIINIGMEALTSIKFNAQVGDAVEEFEWTGELPSGDNTNLGFTIDVPFGTYVGTLRITEANGQPYEASKDFSAESLEWSEVTVNTDVTNVKLYIIQDVFGDQITWTLTNSAGEVVHQGGPYQHLAGSSGTQSNVVNLTNLQSNECYLFRIYDSGNNGICCTYGNGYYYLKDANGNKFIQGSGDYGAEDRRLFSIHRQGYGVEEQDAKGFNIYPNPANNKIYVDGEGVGIVEVYNSLGQKVATVEGSESTNVDVTSFDNGVYMVRVITNDGEITTQKVTITH